MEHSRSKIVKNMLWRLSERYGAEIVQLIVSIVLARILLPEVFGVVAIVIIFVTILQVFIDSGLGSALIQKKDADDLDFSTVFYFNIVLCVVLYIVLFFLAPIIAGFFEIEILTDVVRVLSIMIIFSSLKNVQQAYVAKHMMFKKFFFSTLVGTVVSAIVGIVMAVKGYGVWAIVAQTLTNNALDTLILWIIVRWRPKLMFSFKRLGILFKYGWKLLVSALLDVFYNNARQVIIGKKYSSTDLAYYNRGNQFPSVIANNISLAVDSVLFPAMSEVQDDKEKVKNITKKSIKVGSYIVFPIMIGLAATTMGVVKLVLTDAWIMCVPIMQILCLDYMLYPIHTANLSAIKAVGRSDYFLYLEIIKKVVGISLLLALMWFGTTMIAVSLLISSLIGTFINSFPNKKLINYGWWEQIKDLLPNLLLAGFMGVCVWGLSFIPIHYIAVLAIQIVAGVLIYFVGSVVTKNETYNYFISVIKKRKEEKKLIKEQQQNNKGESEEGEN